LASFSTGEQFFGNSAPAEAVIRADVGSFLKCRLLAFANSPMRFLAGRYPSSARKKTRQWPFLSSIAKGVNAIEHGSSIVHAVLQIDPPASGACRAP
jgi:hypothetical protein